MESDEFRYFALFSSFSITRPPKPITSFLVDTHPAWLVLFVIFGIFTFIFAPTLLDVLEKIYDSPQFALETSQLGMVDFIREYLGLILLGLYFIVGVIVYGKFKWGGQPG